MDKFMINGKEAKVILPPPYGKAKPKLAYDELERRYRNSQSYLSSERAKNRLFKARFAELKALFEAGIKIADNTARLEELFSTYTHDKETNNGDH